MIPDSDLSRSGSPSAVSEEKADDAKSAVAKSSPGGGAAASGNKGPMTLEELERVILGDSSGHTASMPPGSSGGYPDEDSVSVEFEAAGSPGGFEDLLQRHGTELSPKLARRISDMVPKNMISFQFIARFGR